MLSKLVENLYTNIFFSHYTKRTINQVRLMIGLFWLLSPVIIVTMFIPQMANQDVWDDNRLQCLPPSTVDDKPWIIFLGVLGFVLPFTALIILQVLVLIKQQESMEIILERYEKKVRTSLTPYLLDSLSPGKAQYQNIIKSYNNHVLLITSK